MVQEERPPRRRPRPLAPGHVPGHGGLGDLVSQQSQLSLNPRRAPEQVLTAHAAYELADLGIEARPVQCARHIEAGVSTVTALVPLLGYERAAELAPDKNMVR